MVYRPHSRLFMPSAATAGVVSLLDLKTQLRVDGSEEDDLTVSIGLAAEAQVEAMTQRLLSPRACTLLLPGLPDDQEPIDLPGGDVSALSAVTVDGVALTGCSIIGRNLLVRSTTWPATVAVNYPVSITYTAGFVSVPADLIHAVKVIATHLYANRGDSDAGLPRAAYDLTRPWRVLPI